MKNSIVVIVLLLITVSQAFTQVPYINSVEFTTANPGDPVTIIGSNFSNNAADLEVRFGGAEATITSASVNILEVEVPPGATFDNITVTNTSGSSVKTAFSNELFHVSFGGSTGVASAFDAQQLINDNVTDEDTYDLCLCDFDLDGSLDAAVTNNGSSQLVIHENNNTTTTVSYGETRLSPGFSTINIACGDLDGDGWPDIVATQGGSNNEQFFIFRNLASGTINFGAPQILTIPRNGVNLRFIRRVAIQDLDLDGRPDIVINNTSDNLIDVFENNSVQGAITINPTSQQFEMTATDGRTGGMAGLDVKDLNNDGLPEIVATYNRQSEVYILPNTSEPDAISFDQSIEVSANGGFQNLKIGDVDQDGFNDIVLTAGTAGTPQNSIVILENQTSSAGGTISLTSRTTISNITSPWGLDMGDIDGDGNIDIAVASVGNPGRIFMLLSTDPSSFAFSTTSITTSSNSRNVKIGDLNGDAKPDLSFSHNAGDGEIGEYSILLNRNCLIPVIEPSAATEVCTGQTYSLSVQNSPSATFVWRRNGNIVGSNSNELLVDTSSPRVDSYTVTVTDEGCTQVSDAVSITVESASIASPNASSSAGSTVICAGTEVTFMTGATFTSYEWTGPGGYTSTEQNPVISSIQQDQTGKYTVVGRDADGCISEASEVIVSVENLPIIAVNNDNEDTFCDGSTALLSVTDFGSDYSYKWKRDGGDIAGQTNTSLTVNSSGAYSAVIISNANSCELESLTRNLTTIAIPTNSIVTDPASGLICEDLPVSFIAPAGDQNGQAITHTWDFGDGSATETGETVSHAFTDPSTPTVTLTTSYTDLANCPSVPTTTQLTVQGVPNTANGATIDINTSLPNNGTEKCPSDVISLNVTDLYTNYAWFVDQGVILSTASTLADVSNPQRGDAPVTYNVTATDNAGCDFQASLEISLLASSGITLTTMEQTMVNQDGENEIELTEDQLSVDLAVDNATNIMWTPEEIFDDPTAAMVTAIPNDINILVRVTGTDPSNCVESDSIRIVNPIIRAKGVFSPNGDGIGDECWEITNARSKLDGCTIFIFDSKGQIIKQEEISSATQIDDCIWDGTESGQVLPEGIYYYALKCVNNQDIPSDFGGSILLGR